METIIATPAKSTRLAKKNIVQKLIQKFIPLDILSPYVFFPFASLESFPFGPLTGFEVETQDFVSVQSYIANI